MPRHKTGRYKDYYRKAYAVPYRLHERLKEIPVEGRWRVLLAILEQIRRNREARK
jgi:hypothetical protein